MIVRGIGTHEGAAVAILETPLPSIATATATTRELAESQQVHGIARMVQVSTSPVLMLMDLTISFPEFSKTKGTAGTRPPSTEPAPSYDVYVSQTGDVTSPPTTTGAVHLPLATITPDATTGYADAFLELPIGLWDIIGRAMVVEPSADVQARHQQRLASAQRRVERAEQEVGSVIGSRGRLGILAGVIARSAGAWGNEVSLLDVRRRRAGTDTAAW